jgi:hypothetical protein
MLLTGFAALCCGGDFATTSTARSKRDHASTCISSFWGGFVMKKPRKSKRLILPRVSQRHLTAIGNIVVNWAALEDLMGILINQLVAKERTLGHIILAQMDYRHKRNVLLAILELMREIDPRKNKLEGLLPKIHTAHGLRSIVAHAFWTKGRKRGAIKPMRFEARGSIKAIGHHHNEPNYTAESLHKEAEKIAFLYGELNGLVDWTSYSATIKVITSRSTSTSNA